MRAHPRDVAENGNLAEGVSSLTRPALAQRRMLSSPRFPGCASDPVDSPSGIRNMPGMHQGQPKPLYSGEDPGLHRARELYRQRVWSDAYRALSQADRENALDPEDIESLALAAYLTGRDDEYLSVLERAHHAHLDAGQGARAVRCAFWLGFRLLMRGETGRATGWLSRAERLLKDEAIECAERGYLLLPVVEQHIDAGSFETAYASASDAVAIGERCGDEDLVACGRHQQGRIRLQQGQVATGLALLDETMIAVVAGRLSPLVTGLMYCSVISACQEAYAIDRSREWTAALAGWCEGQPDLIPFVGACQVHRAEILQLQGAWADAVAEAQRACVRSQGINQHAAAAGFYQQGEVHRLKGEFAAAENAYRRASELGFEPQPGLALLRLSQGRTDAAAAAIRRVTGATTERMKRMALLPACIEIMLAAGNVDDARNACCELEQRAQRFDTGVPTAIAAQARAAVNLAEGDAQSALRRLRQAFDVWQRVGAPYAAARVRVLIGRACRALSDEDGARLELDAARSAFERLGATPDLDRIDSLIGDEPAVRTHGLTARELEVLRCVAGGETNKAIAGSLSLSEKTIERHVSNILVKLHVASRTAATTFAYKHKLL
jgi:DNA-binding CsgD family transcriptional regulator